MDRFYRISCLIMGMIALAALIITLIVGVTGVSPTASRAGLIIVISALSLMAALTVLAVTLLKIGGSLPRKIGIYLLHGGLIVLIVGFIITELATVTNSVAEKENSRAQTVAFYVGEPYGSVTFENRNLLGASELFVLENVRTVYGADGKTPDHFEADVSVKDKNSGVNKYEKTITSTSPIYFGGCNFYLMSATQTGDAALFAMAPDDATFVKGASYGADKFGGLRVIGREENFVLESVRTEYYDDGTPKYYEARIAVKDLVSGGTLQEKTLSVNHPAYVNGCKIYLMDASGDGEAAVLLVKYNPGEYVVLIGIVGLVAGAFLTCFSGFSRKRAKKEERASERAAQNGAQNAAPQNGAQNGAQNAAPQGASRGARKGGEKR